MPRFSLRRLLALTTAIALALVVYSQFWRNGDEVRWRVAVGVYLAVLATASAVAFSSPPKWSRFWFAYSLFGWAYFVFVMRLPLLIPPKGFESQTNHVPTAAAGILLGFICAFAALVLPGPVEAPKGRYDKGGESPK